MHTTPAPRVQPILARALVLTGLAILAAASAASAQLGEEGGILDDPAVTGYRLTIDKLEPFIATVHAIDQLGETEEMQALEEMADDAGLEEIVATLEGEPLVREAIEGAGLTAREYITFSFALVNAMFGSLVVSLGGEAALEEIEDDVLRENVRFYLAHEETFDRLGEDGG